MLLKKNSPTIIIYSFVVGFTLFCAFEINCAFVFSMALNLINRMEGGTNAKYSINDAEKTIGRLMAGKWLRKLDRGCVGIGVRFVGEMGDWISQVLIYQPFERHNMLLRLSFSVVKLTG